MIKNLLTKSSVIITSLFFLSLAQASINYSGRIIDQSTSNPLSSADSRIQMSMKIGACTIYQENHDSIDFSSSNGYFSQNLGEGSATHGVFADAIKNSGSVSCLEGGSSTLSESSNRSLSISFYDGSGYSNLVASIPNLALKKSQDSYNSRLLNGKSSSSFIEQAGSVSQLVLEELSSGASSLYASASSLATSFYNKTESDAKFLDKTNLTQARTDLGLGSLSTKSSVSNLDITDVSYSKITGVPSFALSSHSHAISDITNLQTSLDEKLAKASFPSCSISQVPIYVSVSDTFSCSNISISSTQVSGLGPLATANQIGDSAISDLAGSKLTGPVQIGNVAGSTCSTAGLIRYNSGALEICSGSSWLASPVGQANVIASAYKSGGSITVNTTITGWTIEGDSFNAFNATTGVFTVPVAGDYLFAGGVGLNSGTPIPSVFVNGNIMIGGSSAGGRALVSGILKNLAVGDQVTMRTEGAGGTSNSGPAGTRFAISRLASSSPLVNIIAKYRVAGAVSGSTSAPFNYSVKVFDANNTVTIGSAWKFTAPIGGIYRISATYVDPSVASYILAYKNGTASDPITTVVASAAPHSGSVLVELSAGDYLDVRPHVSASLNATALVGYNSVSIERVGNAGL